MVEDPVYTRYTPCSHQHREYGLIQIESGVVIPSHRSMYPFADMLPGDSFLIQDRKKADSARVASLRFVKRLQPDWSFVMRKVDNGWRIWQTA